MVPKFAAAATVDCNRAVVLPGTLRSNKVLLSAAFCDSLSGMKPPLPAVLYGTGLLLAFGSGWFFKPASSPDNTAALSHPARQATQPTDSSKAGECFGGFWGKLAGCCLCRYCGRPRGQAAGRGESGAAR